MGKYTSIILYWTTIKYLGGSKFYIHFRKLYDAKLLEKSSSVFEQMKWIGLNWARRTFWGWWDDWDDTVLQTQGSKFEPWWSEAEHATSRSRRLPTILTFTRGWGRNIFVSFKPPRPGTEPRTLAWKAAVLTTTLGPPPVFEQTFSASLFRKRNALKNDFEINWRECVQN